MGFSLGRLAQLVRAPALQAGGPQFEPATAHQEPGTGSEGAGPERWLTLRRPTPKSRIPTWQEAAASRSILGVHLVVSERQLDVAGVRRQPWEEEVARRVVPARFPVVREVPANMQRGRVVEPAIAAPVIDIIQTGRIRWRRRTPQIAVARRTSGLSQGKRYYYRSLWSRLGTAFLSRARSKRFCDANEFGATGH
jgi:hypothetical protein